MILAHGPVLLLEGRQEGHQEVVLLRSFLEEYEVSMSTMPNYDMGAAGIPPLLHTKTTTQCWGTAHHSGRSAAMSRSPKLGSALR